MVLKLSRLPDGEPEVFTTIQGEGVSAGVPSTFVRLSLCSLRCVWCFVPETPVLMADWTSKPIEQVQEGDLVWSYKGRGYTISRVLATYRRVVGETVRVVTSRGSVTCTPEHVFHTNHHRSHRRKCVAASLTGRYIKLTKLGRSEEEEVLVPTQEYLRGYLQGAYAGDGSADHWGIYPKVYFQVTDRDFADRVLEIVNAHGHNCTVTTSKRRTVSGKPVYRVSCGLRGIDFILDLPRTREEVRGYIAGFFDAEGSVSRAGHQLSITQKDDKVLHRVEAMLHGFGFCPYYGEYRGRGHRAVDTLVVNGLPEVERFMHVFQPAIARKRERARRDTRRQMTAVQVDSVEPGGAAEVCNVTTTTGNFFANGFLVDQCDTKFTWDWERYDPRVEIVRLEVREVARRILAGGTRNVVITGGEPLLQQGEVALLAAELKGAGRRLEVETSGTVLPQPGLAALIDQWNVSPKLASSGNPEARREVPEALRWFAAQNNAYLKFVITAPEDVEEARGLVERYGAPPERVLLMPEGTTAAALAERSAWLVGRCQALGYRYSTRLHVLLWGDKRGR